MITAFSMITASAWSTPKFMLTADYNDSKKTIAVEYRLLDFAGTESADFRLKYNNESLEMTDYEKAKMQDVMMEINDNDGLISIQFVDLEHVREEDCDSDGSAAIAVFTFKVKDENADSTAFIATADSCQMDPDSSAVSLDRATLKIPLTEGSVKRSTAEDYSMISSNDDKNQKNVNKVILAAVIAAAVFILLLVWIVIKYRRKP